MGIPTEEMKAILEQFAIKTKKDWKFKLPVDQDFIDKWGKIIVPILAVESKFNLNVNSGTRTW